jgi:hypothetical protein
MNMLKKLVVTAIAAAAMTVPLAGMACADTGTNAGSTGNGIGQGVSLCTKTGFPARLSVSMQRSRALPLTQFPIALSVNFRPVTRCRIKFLLEIS